MEQQKDNEMIIFKNFLQTSYTTQLNTISPIIGGKMLAFSQNGITMFFIVFGAECLAGG
jgi:hypothetical protein